MYEIVYCSNLSSIIGLLSVAMDPIHSLSAYLLTTFHVRGELRPLLTTSPQRQKLFSVPQIQNGES